MTRRVTATDFARGLSEFLNRVRYARETFVVQRGNMDVCEVRPVRYASTCTGADLARLLREVPHPGEDYLRAVADGVDRQPPAEDSKWGR